MEIHSRKRCSIQNERLIQERDQVKQRNQHESMRIENTSSQMNSTKTDGPNQKRLIESNRERYAYMRNRKGMLASRIKRAEAIADYPEH